MMPRNPWFRAGFDAWSLGVEASSVIALRTLKILAGGAAAKREAHRMVSEKIEAGLALQALALTGALGWHSDAPRSLKVANGSILPLTAHQRGRRRHVHHCDLASHHHPEQGG
jgi:hypothetical protein